MDVLLEGTIGDGCDMVGILQSVLSHTGDAKALLRITSNPVAVNGRLAINSSGYIVGAREANGDTGYAAIKKLLSVRNGSFALLSADSDEFAKIKQNIYVRIDRLLSHISSIDTLTDGIFESWGRSDRELEAEVLKQDQEGENTADDSGAGAVLAAEALACSKYVSSMPAKPERFAKLQKWEKNSERFVGVFYWLAFVVIAAGAAFWVLCPH